MSLFKRKLLALIIALSLSAICDILVFFDVAPIYFDTLSNNFMILFAGMFIMAIISQPKTEEESNET
jgi:hypothetical protein